MNLKRQEKGNEREQARGPSPTSVLLHPLNPATGKMGESQPFTNGKFLSNYNSNTNMNANASFLGKRRSGNRYRRRLSFVFIVVLAVLIVGIFHVLSYLQVNQLHSMTSAADVLAFSYLFASGVLNGMNFGTLKSAQFESRPIVVVIQDPGRNALDVDYSSSNVQRTIELSKEQKHLLKHPVSSRDARHRKTDTFVEGNCVQSKDWQLTTFPACNSIHEYDMASKTGDDHDTVKLINHGYWRDVWKVNDVNKKEYVLKTIRYEHEYTERNFDRHRRDALAMERLTASENIVDIYGFCGNSGIFQYSQEGDVSSMIWGRHSKNYTSIEALYTAEQVAAGIAAAHTFDSEEFATLAHTDITPSQFVRIDGKFRLNDFNRCRFIRWDKENNSPCTYHVGQNPGKFRSPEEYAKGHIQTEKVDVYSMGNIFYGLLTKKWPFEDYTDEKAQSKVKKGNTPHVPSGVKDSNDPAIKAILLAMEKSFIKDPAKRATARQVHSFLKDALTKIESGNDYEPKWIL